MNTIDNFKTYVQNITSQGNYAKPLAFGLGIRRSKGEKTLDVHFPVINWDTAFGTAALLQDVVRYNAGENGFACFSRLKIQLELLLMLGLRILK